MNIINYRALIMSSHIEKAFILTAVCSVGKAKCNRSAHVTFKFWSDKTTPKNRSGLVI